VSRQGIGEGLESEGASPVLPDFVEEVCSVWRCVSNRVLPEMW
jgi:hypothetical protein